MLNRSHFPWQASVCNQDFAVRRARLTRRGCSLFYINNQFTRQLFSCNTYPSRLLQAKPSCNGTKATGPSIWRSIFCSLRVRRSNSCLPSGPTGTIMRPPTAS